MSVDLFMDLLTVGSSVVRVRYHRANISLIMKIFTEKINSFIRTNKVRVSSYESTENKKDNAISFFPKLKK